MHHLLDSEDMLSVGPATAPARVECAAAIRAIHRMSTLRAARVAVLSAILLSPGAAVAGSLYAPWKNGPPQNPAFFPIAVWWQNPMETGHSGSYPTVANAVAGTGMNIFLGLGTLVNDGQQGWQDGWPEAFGADWGELEAIKANNLYAIAGIETPYNENNLPQSVASIQALANAIGADANLIGYNAGDEPSCQGGGNGQYAFSQVPGVIKGINSYDPTRVVTLNETAWMLYPPGWSQCLNASQAALQSTSIASFDLYPLTSPWIPQAGYFPGSEAKSDFKSIPNDTLWAQGAATRALFHYAASNQPAWVYIEAGGDNLGFSSQSNNFAGGVTNGSATLTNVSGWSSFTATWIGLTVSGNGIPANTKIASITDATHAVLSQKAQSTSTSETITVTGGAGPYPGADCVASANLCVVNGNEYRPTPAQVFSEVWMSLISGANGIEYFCHDTLSDSFCLGDQLGGAQAAAAAKNIKYIDLTVNSFAEELNSPTVGACSMQQENYASGSFSITGSCSNEMLSIGTSNSAVPGLAMVKQYNGYYYLFAQSDRRSAAGATFTYTLAGLGGQTAELVYDSDTYYDPSHTESGATFTLNAKAQFADVLGANGDHYQVKVYKIK